MDKDRIVGDSDLYGFNYYLYGEAYLGSYRGHRFRLAREPLKNVVFSSKEEQSKDASFLADIWPEPWSYEKRDPEETEEERFPFTEEGFKEAVLWIRRGVEDGK